MKELKSEQLFSSELLFRKEFNKQEFLQFKSNNRFRYFESELQLLFQYLQNHIATASMITEATGIPQKNICRYKRQLEKAGKLWEVEKKKCRETGFEAWYITTNPTYVSSSKQLSLF